MKSSREKGRLFYVGSFESIANRFIWLFHDVANSSVHYKFLWLYACQVFRFKYDSLMAPYGSRKFIRWIP